jgi:hypothetical protein
MTIGEGRRRCEVADLDKTVVLLQICGELEQGTNERVATRIAGDIKSEAGRTCGKGSEGLGAGKTCMSEDVERR